MKISYTRSLQRIWEVIQFPLLYLLAIVISPVLAYLFIMFSFYSFMILDKIFN